METGSCAALITLQLVMEACTRRKRLTLRTKQPFELSEYNPPIVARVIPVKDPDSSFLVNGGE